MQIHTVDRPSTPQTLEESQFSLIEAVKEEYTKGLLALNSIGAYSVTFYGGSKVKSEDKSYQDVQKLAAMFAKKGWGVASGGGPGIMEAALKGAQNCGGKAIALRINIKDEPSTLKPDVDINFTQFSVRKYMLRQSDVFVFAPGGLGTLDELMEILTLTKTHKFPQKPVFLYDSEFWKGYLKWFKEILLKDRGVVDESFMDMFTVVDSPEEVIDKIGLLD